MQGYVVIIKTDIELEGQKVKQVILDANPDMAIIFAPFEIKKNMLRAIFISNCNIDIQHRNQVIKSIALNPSMFNNGANIDTIDVKIMSLKNIKVNMYRSMLFSENLDCVLNYQQYINVNQELEKINNEFMNVYRTNFDESKYVYDIDIANYERIYTLNKHSENLLNSKNDRLYNKGLNYYKLPSFFGYNKDYRKEIEKLEQSSETIKTRNNYILICDKINKYSDNLVGNMFRKFKELGIVTTEKYNDFDFDEIFSGMTEDMQFNFGLKAEKGGMAVIHMPFQYDIVARNAIADKKSPTINANVNPMLYQVSKQIKSAVDGLIKIIKEANGEVVFIFIFENELSYDKNRIFEIELSGIPFKLINFNEIEKSFVNDYFKYRLSEEKLNVSTNELMDIFNNSDNVSFEIQKTRTLNYIFDRWKNEYMYKNGYITKSEHDEYVKKHKSGVEELAELLGEDEVKEEIKNICNTYYAQKIRKNLGLEEVITSKHMVFTGNPGTGKTTVARIFAKILYEKGIIDSDKIIELGKDDLVSKWIGETDEKCKAKIADAIGGVLFIDEAYSIAQDVHDKNIIMNIFVREMENNRNKIIMLFAGYDNEMKDFMSINSGFESRVKKKIHFKDFTLKELESIANSYAKSKDYHITNDGMSKFVELCKNEMKKSNFSNGRYVRNIIEAAIERQSTRIFSYANSIRSANISTDKLTELKAIDFPNVNIEEKKVIGFH